MILKAAPLMVLATATTFTTTISETFPAWLAQASEQYEACLFNAIDQQYETGRFSEKVVLLRCANVRHRQIEVAELASTRATSAKNSQEMISREFARLDESVWTIVGHIREQRNIGRNGS